VTSVLSDTFQLLPREELSRRRSRLLARIERHYDTAEETFLIGPLRLQFTRVKNPDSVLDEICGREDQREQRSGERKQGDQLHLPYWAELWDSSIGLGHFLMRWERRKQRVLDLGCGMGLAGTVAAAMGHEVLLADLESPALLFAKLNTLPFSSRARTRQLDWQRDRLDEKFDLILGADVVYEREQWQYLEPFWQAHLALGGSVLLAEPGRQTGDLFIEWITHRGWMLLQHEQAIPLRGKPIRLFELTR
jgi:protein N-lysine methyltransferase METTL21A